MANAAERITDVLSLLAKHPYGLSAVEVAEALCLSRTAASRLLTLMADASLVEREQPTQRYVLGLNLWLTGAAALQRLNVVELSLLPMAEAVSAHGTPLFLGVNRGPETYVIRAVDSVHGFAIVNPVALIRPIPEFATGKAILAFDSPDRIAAALADLSLGDPGGVERQNRFAVELEGIRERGYALKFCNGETAVNGIAVPIIDRTGYAVAGLGATLDEIAVTDFSPEPVLSVIKGAADAISRYLGHTRFTAAVVP
jgi:IclR family KDG regulon transcriptional repressor